MKSTYLEVVENRSDDLITLDQAAETLAMRWLLAYASIRTRENYRAALNRSTQPAPSLTTSPVAKSHPKPNQEN